VSRIDYINPRIWPPQGKATAAHLFSSYLLVCVSDRPTSASLLCHSSLWFAPSFSYFSVLANRSRLVNAYRSCFTELQPPSPRHLRPPLPCQHRPASLRHHHRHSSSTTSARRTDTFASPVFVVPLCAFQSARERGLSPQELQKYYNLELTVLGLLGSAPYTSDVSFLG